jgi:hypothetical protein
MIHMHLGFELEFMFDLGQMFLLVVIMSLDFRAHANRVLSCLRRMRNEDLATSDASGFGVEGDGLTEDRWNPVEYASMMQPTLV